MPAVDLGLEYRGGVNVPDPKDEGAVAFVAPADGDGAYNFRYGRAAKPRGLDGVDSFDLYPLVVRTRTPDATPIHVATITIPNGYDLDARVSAIATNGVNERREYQRGRFQNRANVVQNLYGGTGLVAEEAAFGSLAVPATCITRVVISTGVQFWVTGLAGSVSWTVSVLGRLTKVYDL